MEKNKWEKTSGNQESRSTGSRESDFSAALSKDVLITHGALDRHQATEFNTKSRLSSNY